MSRKAAREYILCRRDDYLGEISKRRKGRILDEACRVTGLERKHVIKLLRGTLQYRERKGRGSAYTAGAAALLAEAWAGDNYPCAKYLKSHIGRVVRDLSELERVDADAAGQVLRMSASTMERLLRGKPRKRAWGRRNRRSGSNGVMALIPCESGEREPACGARPGDIQVDSVALCGGDGGGDFFWAATATDRLTQWFEARPSFNLCAANYVPAFEANLRHFPFPPAGGALRQRVGVHERRDLPAHGGEVARGAAQQVLARPEEPQRAHRAEERLRRQGLPGRPPAGPAGAPEKARAPVRGHLPLEQLLPPVRHARLQGEAPGREGVPLPVRRPEDSGAKGD